MNNQIYRPGEFIKYMNVEMHPTLLEMWYCADIAREVSSLGAQVVPSSDLFEPAVVTWSRRMKPELHNDNGQIQLAHKEECNRAVYVQCAEETAAHVNAKTWCEHVARVRAVAGRRMTVAVFGVRNYFRETGRRRNVNNQQRNTNGMTAIDLEMAIADLLVSTDCDASIVNTPNELALLIAQFTKALAEAPLKKAKRDADEQAEFYMRGDKKKCVAVDKNGNGVARLWQQMLGVLPSSSLETARALCAQYKSPAEFFEALQRPNIVSELADIEVDRAGLPGARCRRVGPELARRLHALFTADDGDLVLD